MITLFGKYIFKTPVFAVPVSYFAFVPLCRFSLTISILMKSCDRRVNSIYVFLFEKYFFTLEFMNRMFYTHDANSGAQLREVQPIPGDTRDRTCACPYMCKSYSTSETTSLAFLEDFLKVSMV